MLGKGGLLAMVGKAERGPETLQSIAKFRSAYLIAVGGAAFLVSNAIRSSRVVAFPELGMEAVYEFEVRDMPVTVAVSSDGESVHDTGPLAWRGKFAGIPVAVE
jgi:fumarate hydratase class I